MSVSELDSFYFKFKNLLIAEKKSEEGRTQVTLHVDLGNLVLESGSEQPQKGRNGPARRKRHEFIAAACCQNVLKNYKVAEKDVT